MFKKSYAALILPLANCPPESTRGFLRLGGGVGASPDNHDGSGVASIEAVSAGTTGFFFGAPSPSIILSPKTCTAQLGVP